MDLKLYVSKIIKIQRLSLLKKMNKTKIFLAYKWITSLIILGCFIRSILQ